MIRKYWRKNSPMHCALVAGCERQTEPRITAARKIGASPSQLIIMQAASSVCQNITKRTVKALHFASKQGKDRVKGRVMGKIIITDKSTPENFHCLQAPLSFSSRDGYCNTKFQAHIHICKGQSFKDPPRSSTRAHSSYSLYVEIGKSRIALHSIKQDLVFFFKKNNTVCYM